MSKHFRIEQLRANVPSPAGVIYPEEVMQEIVRQASKRADEKTLLIYSDVGTDSHSDLRNILGVVSKIELIFGWIEIDFDTIGATGERTNVLEGIESDMLQIVPHMQVVRSNKKGSLVVHEAAIQYFVVGILPSIRRDVTLHNTNAQSQDNSDA